MHKVEEMHTTCDAKPGMNVTYTGSASHHRVFLDNEILQTGTTASDFMTAHRTGLAHFASVLQDCATIYNLPPSSLQIFYDASGTTMAFNQNQSLFFNYRYFKQDHLAMLESGDKDLPVRHWATTTAHELAHNIEADHNVRFQNVWQALIETHIPNIAEVARRVTAAAPPTAGPARQAPPRPNPARAPPSGTAAFKGAFKR